MAEQTQLVYKDRDMIISEVLAAWQARIPDIVTGADSVVRIWTEVFGETVEGLFLAMQLLHDDIFIQSQNALALIRAGEQYGRPQKTGILATGNVVFTGSGGTYIPIGTTVGAPRPSVEDTLYFDTTTDATIPAPGVPTALVAADAGSGSAPAAGTYEYVVTFQTAAGETVAGVISNALVLSVAHTINLTSIPLGGAGTTGRRIYRRVNGGAWGILTTIANNTATTYTDNNASTTGGTPPTSSTAEAITVPVQAQEVGAEYNVAIGAITEMTDTIANLTSVTNPAAFTNGTDDEDIEQFRSALLDYVRNPASGSPDDLASWAEAIDGIESAAVFPNVNLAGASAPGTVSVRVAGPDGAIPSGALVTAVQAALASQDLANITILVGTFTANVINVAATITVASGYVLADVTTDITNAIIDYINSVQVGATVYRAGLTDAIFGLPGVADVNVTAPAANVTSTATQKPTVGTVTLT